MCGRLACFACTQHVHASNRIACPIRMRAAVNLRALRRVTIGRSRSVMM